MGTGSLVLVLNILVVTFISLAWVTEKRRLAKEEEQRLEVESKGFTESKESTDTKL